MALLFMRAAKRHMTHSDMSLPTRSPETPDSESAPQCVQCYCTASASTRHVWNRMVATLTVPGTVCAGHHQQRRDARHALRRLLVGSTTSASNQVTTAVYTVPHVNPPLRASAQAQSLVWWADCWSFAARFCGKNHCYTLPVLCSHVTTSMARAVL